jgi:integrase
MKGHIRRRSPGHWAIVLDSRDTENKRKRKWHSFRGTKREAEVECARLIAELQTGCALEATKATLREYLDRWLDHMRSQVSLRSWENYRDIVAANIVPALGNVVLAKLRPAEIAKAYSDALAHGRRNKSGLSPRSVLGIHRALSQALKQAVIWRLIPQNPAALVKPPRVERKQMQVLSVADTAALIEFARDGDLFMPILLSALCGLRRGELMALRWRAIDLNAGQLSVRASLEQTSQGLREKPPKSGRPRTVALPALVVEELRRHRLRQAEDLLRLGIRQTEDTHVCLRKTGEPWPPRLFTFTFIRLIRRSGLPCVRFHDLRHSHATHLLAENVHPKIVQERLGHATIAMTMDLYSHVIPGIQEDAAATLDTAMRAALQAVARR